MKNIIHVGDYIRTPRFLSVQIEAVFDCEDAMRAAGYTEPTHFQDGDYLVMGKSIGLNRMCFAAAFKRKNDAKLRTYIALYQSQAVRNAEIFVGSNIRDMVQVCEDDSCWDLNEGCEVFIGIYSGTSVNEIEAKVCEEHNTTPDCIRLIPVN